MSRGHAGRRDSGKYRGNREGIRTLQCSVPDRLRHHLLFQRFRLQTRVQSKVRAEVGDLDPGQPFCRSQSRQGNQPKENDHSKSKP